MQHFKKKLKIDRTVRPCFEIDFNELKMEKQISEGGFGMIYRARWRETTVAVKVLKPDLMREETIKDFLSKNSKFYFFRRVLRNGKSKTPKHRDVHGSLHQTTKSGYCT